MRRANEIIIARQDQITAILSAAILFITPKGSLVYSLVYSLVHSRAYSRAYSRAHSRVYPPASPRELNNCRTHYLIKRDAREDDELGRRREAS
jgi:hypothetical protein